MNKLWRSVLEILIGAIVLVVGLLTIQLLVTYDPNGYVLAVVMVVVFGKLIGSVIFKEDK